MTDLAICRDPRGLRPWNLGPLPPPHGTMVLLRVGTTEDGDAYPDVDRVLARALCSLARVTSRREPVEPPLTEAWEPRGERFVMAFPLGPGRAWTRRLAERLGFHETHGLVSTRRPENVTAIFDDPAWSLEAQIAVLSEPEAAPPVLTAEHLDALFTPAWTETVLALASEKVVGALRPGVDGAVAGLFASTRDLSDAMVSAIVREAEALGVPYAFVGEADLWITSDRSARSDR